jgi:ubiquinone/menaquinone biosynthesis C-methylase UbiE
VALVTKRPAVDGRPDAMIREADPGGGMTQETWRYDRLAEQYSQYRPRYPDRLISHLAAIIIEAEASPADLVVDVGAGTGIFTRQLRAALPGEIRIIGIEPSVSMRQQAIAETADLAGLVFREGVAEQMPFVEETARAVVAATAAHWFDRPVFYAEARRILVPGGILPIVEYVRDRTGSPIAAALTEFMAQYGSPRAYMPADYRRELAGAVGFCNTSLFTRRCRRRPDIAAFIGLALSSSHAAGVIERFGTDGARSALRELAAPHRVDEEHVLFGYVFTCLTARRDA